MSSPTAFVVMGVSGCGKSTVASLLAEHLGGTYLDADDLHSEQARALMASGVPLTDADRAPWLRKVGEVLADLTERGLAPVMACSALRRQYRDQIRSGAGVPVAFVHLNGPPDLIAERMGAREGHFMPPALLDSQMQTLEALQADEFGVVVDIAAEPQLIVEAVAAAVREAAEG